MKIKAKFNEELFGKAVFEARTTNIRLIRKDNDSSTSDREIIDGHKKYCEHVSRERKRLGLE
jgi:hypothetical protein